MLFVKSWKKYFFNICTTLLLTTKYFTNVNLDFNLNDSTVNQLVEIYNTVILNMDKGKDIRFVFCYISKAFDKVWHNGLLFILDIIYNLTDRKQKVVVEGSINAGVPRGSVLGLCLFLLYINDISNGLANSIKLFADDATLYATVACDIKM